MGIDNLIEQQIRRWSEARKKKQRDKMPYMPVIAISRERGSGGTIVARKVAEKLGFDFFHRKIVDEIAKHRDKSHDIIQSMDEKVVGDMESLINSIIKREHLDQTEYLESLMKVILAIATKGSAVIVGRGAYYILGAQKSLRVRILCPTEVRIKKLAQREKISEWTARGEVEKTDKERRAFIEKYFHKDIRNPVYDDLIINSEHIPEDTLVDVIVSTYKGRFGIK